MLVLGSIFLGLIFLECFSRLVFAFNFSNRDGLYQMDPEIGWWPKPNLNYKKVLSSSQGRQYSALYTSDENGIRYSPREWKASSNIDNGDSSQNNNPNLRKVLIIGDSFTGDFHSSDSSAWYSYIDRNADLDVWAFGIGGSGATQQMLAFKRLQPILRPDILLIQFCSNDPENDFFANSYISGVYNQEWFRPYLVDGEVVRRNDIPASVYRQLYASSDLFKLIDRSVLKIRSQFFPETIESLSAPQLEAAVENWKNIYRTYVSTALNSGVKEVWSVTCSGYPGEDANRTQDMWREYSEELGVKVFLSFSDSVSSANEAGIDTKSADGAHWNDVGNKIAGQALANEINSYLNTKALKD